MRAWSYSSIKMFDQCPKKYFHLRVVKDVKEKISEQIIYGNEVHKAAEEYIKSDTPIPPKFNNIQKVVDALKNIPGEKHCELRLGVGVEDYVYKPTGFFDKKVWLRTIVDLLILPDETNAFMVDYKTGKNSKYADLKQLDIMAGAVFVHHPKLEKIKSALAYTTSGELIRKEHLVEKRDEYLETFSPELNRLDSAYSSGVWNPNSGPLCAWCPVVQCEHHRER
jgi:hypothetical protein